MSATVGNDLLSGTAGNDVIDLLAGDDSYTGLGGNDSILGGDGTDSLSGGDGTDTMLGGNSNDTIIGGNGNDSFAGNSGNDSLVGGDGADTLYGGSGNDTIAGGNGDNIIYGESGSDSIDAGAGTFDIVRFNHSGAEAIFATIGAVGGERGYNSATVATATQGTDTVINFEQIEGSIDNDTFNITDAATYYVAAFVFAGSGNDTIMSNISPRSSFFSIFADYNAASSNAGFTRGVSVDLHIGNDFLGRPIGSATDYAGTDSLVGVRAVAGTYLADTIYGTAFNDRFRPYAGNDIMDGREGFDMVDYGTNSSSQAVSVNLVTGRASDGRGGADTLISIENVRGGSGNDTLLGDRFSEAFRGGVGNDSIDGGLGSDRIEYFDTSATSGVSVNLLTGTASDGRGGTDSFTSIENAYGGELNDYLVGASQRFATSRLRGDAGSDTLVGIDGEYVVADYSSQTMELSVNLASGNVNDGLGGVDVLINIRGVQMSGNYADTLIGTTGDDWLSPGAGNDSIVGGDGVDILHYGGNPTMGASVNLATGTASDGDDGTDIFTGIEAVVTGYSNDTVIGNGARNYIGLGAGADYADGADGVDVISYRINFSDDAVAYAYNESGNGRLFSGVTIDLAAGRATDYGNSVDTIINFEDAEGSTMHDSILGSSGDNQLDGWEGNDTINAGGGNDTIWSDDGNDLFMGGAGNDLYLMAYGSGEVTINDASGNDTVSLAGVTGQEITTNDIVSATGIDAIDLAGGGNTLHLTAAQVIGSSGTGLLRAFGGSGDRVIFDDAGWALVGSSGGFDTMSNVAGNATVIASTGLMSSDTGSVINGGDGNDTLGGGTGADTIDGGNGSDIIAGFGGNDSILGGDGSDSIYGGNGADSIAGGNGDDRIYGEAGSDTIDAGAGTADRILYNQTGGEAITAIINSSGGNAGTNTATVGTATQGTDIIQGFELLVGSGNGDLITVTTAATQNFNLFLFGGAGNDTIIDNYRVNGVFADYNTPSADLTSGISVDLTSGIATDGFGGTDSLVGITAVNGTSFADTMLGTASNDRFRGWQGNDLMDGRGGTGDMVDYAANASSQAVSVNLASGSANDGMSGTDTLISIEQVRGGAGNDLIIGDANNNNFRGNNGNDTMDGGAGTLDVVDYSFASGAVSVNLNDSVASDGANGTDRLVNIEVVWGSSLNDTLIGGAGNDVLRGNGGGDSLVGGAGSADIADYRNATTGITVNLATGAVQDGQGGIDTLNSIEQISGGTFNDSMLGGLGNDSLLGGDGADTLDGGGGADTMSGGNGDDFFVVGDGDVVQELGGFDTILLRRGSISLPGVSVENVIGDAAGLAFSITGSSLANQLTGGDLNDTILSYQSNDTVNGLGGNDLIYGGTENDSLLGGDGADVLYGEAGGDTVLGGAGNDLVSGGSDADRLDGGLGNDCLDGGSGTDQFHFNTALGAANVDAIQGYVAVDDVIVLDRTVFTAFSSAGTLSASAFNTGTSASDADDRIIYNAGTGALLYDADGVGGSAAVQFATLTGVSGIINNTEFLII